MFSIPNYAQELEALELRINIRNNENGRTIYATLELVSEECWNAIVTDVNDHDITNAYLGSSVSTVLNNNKIGWNVCWRVSPDEKIGLGKYKVTVTTNGELYDYFYIEYRTSDLPEVYSASDDIDVYLNATNGTLYWNSNLTNQLGTDYTIWGLSTIKQTNITLKTTELEPYISTNLIQTANFGSPIVEWNHPQIANNYRTGYRLYRSIGSTSNFNLISTIHPDLTRYRDIGMIINGGAHAYYKLTAINGTRESVFSNTIDVSIIAIDKTNYLTNGAEDFEFSLSQNYPNPFNPATIIKFSTPLASNLELILYDILGKEITTLLNEYKQPGEYEINFDAKGLSSGVYYYVMTTGEYSIAKKLVIVK